MSSSIVMTTEKCRKFVKEGVIILRQLVPQDLCHAAVKAINAKKGGGAEPIQALYHNSSLSTLVQGLLGGKTLPVNAAQIAVRQPTPMEQLDIYQGGFNGNRGQRIPIVKLKS